MTRVGIIANTFDDTFGGLAGGHVHFIEVAKRWPDLDVVVFAPEIARELISRTLPDAHFTAMPSISLLHSQRQLTTLFRSISAPLRFRELRSCDVLLATSQFLPDLIPALFARHFKFIATVPHLLDPPETRSGSRFANILSFAFQALSIRLIRRYAPVVLVNTLDTSRRIAYDPRRTIVHVMTHGVDQVAGHTRTRPRNKDALFLGRLVPTKGVDELLHAWKKIVAKVPDATLTIAGSGNPLYVGELRRLCAELELADVVDFTGRVSDERRIELFQTHRVFVFPSKEEGWGIVLAEAMANGLPCVTYDLKAYEDVFVRGRRSVPLSDTDAFASAVTLLLENHTVWSELAIEAQALGKTFSWDQAAEIERRAIRDALG